MAVTDFIHVNGFRVRCFRGGSQAFTPSYFGRVTRTVRGNNRQDRHNLEETFSFETSHLDEDLAMSLQGWISGHWHHFPYDADFWSSDGYVHGPTYTASIVASSYANITTITYDMELFEPWTITALVNPGSGWRRHTVRHDGAKWENAVRNDSLSTTWLAVDSDTGQVSLTSQNVDDMIIMRFHLHEDMLKAFHIWQNAGNAWSKYLKVEGKFWDEGEHEAVGMAKTVRSSDHPTKGKLSFDLELR